MGFILLVTASRPALEQPGHETDRSPLSSAKVKNLWICTYTLPYVFMTWYLIKHRIRLSGVVVTHGDNFTLRICTSD